MNLGPIFPLLAASSAAARLLTALPSAPVINREQLAVWRVQGPTGAPADSTPVNGLNAQLLLPDAAGVIDLAVRMTAEQRAADQAQPANPFQLRYHPAFVARTVTVTVGGIIRGAARDRDCCVLNDRALRTGESFEGLTVAEIGENRVVLQNARYQLALPAGDRPLTLRLAQ